MGNDERYRASIGFNLKDKRQKDAVHIIKRVKGSRGDFISKAIMSYIFDNPSEGIIELSKYDKDLASHFLKQIQGEKGNSIQVIPDVGTEESVIKDTISIKEVSPKKKINNNSENKERIGDKKKKKKPAKILDSKKIDEVIDINKSTEEDENLALALSDLELLNSM